MKKLLCIFLFSGFCMAMNGADRHTVLVFTMMQQLQLREPVQLRREEREELLQAILCQQSEKGTMRRQHKKHNNNHFTQMRFTRENARIHQPQNNNYAVKNRR